MVASNFAPWLALFRIPEALTIAQRRDCLIWAMLDHAVLRSELHCMSHVVTPWDPSSALVPLDIKCNWVDKSSLLLYDELPHFLSFLGSCWEKSEKCALALAVVQTFCLQFFVWQRGDNFVVVLLMLMQREFEGLSFFFCPQFNLWSSFHPFWRLTRDRSFEQGCLLLTFEREKLSRQLGYFLYLKYSLGYSELSFHVWFFLTAIVFEVKWRQF